MTYLEYLIPDIFLRFLRQASQFYVYFLKRKDGFLQGYLWYFRVFPNLQSKNIIASCSYQVFLFYTPQSVRADLYIYIYIYQCKEVRSYNNDTSGALQLALALGDRRNRYGRHLIPSSRAIYQHCVTGE